MEICFIVNPIAGKGKGKTVAKQIEGYMKEIAVPYEIRFTTRSREAENLALVASMEGYKKIVAVGGDGTVYEVVNGIIGRDITLGIVPSGTGNDFARSLGVGKSIETALDTVVYGRERLVDCGKANNRYFVNVAGIGFDTDILKEAEKIKKYFSGPWAYLAGVFKTLIHYKYKKIHMTIDSEQYQKEILLVAFANGNYYGGGMKIAPDADMEDGYFDICVIHKIPKLKVLRLFPTIFAGKHIEVEEVSIYRGKKVELYGDSPMPINLDGDLVGTTPLTIEIVPKSLKLMSPMLDKPESHSNSRVR